MSRSGKDVHNPLLDQLSDIISKGSSNPKNYRHHFGCHDEFTQGFCEHSAKQNPKYKDYQIKSYYKGLFAEVSNKWTLSQRLDIMADFNKDLTSFKGTQEYEEQERHHEDNYDSVNYHPTDSEDNYDSY